MLMGRFVVTLFVVSLLTVLNEAIDPWFPAISIGMYLGYRAGKRDWLEEP